MSKVNIRIFSRPNMDELNVSVDGFEPYSFSPHPGIDMEDFLEWLFNQLEAENVRITDETKKS